MLALLSACSTLHAAPGAARAVVPPRAVSPLMASWTAADMKSKRLKLPEEVRTHPRLIDDRTALVGHPPCSSTPFSPTRLASRVRADEAAARHRDGDCAPLQRDGRDVEGDRRSNRQGPAPVERGRRAEAQLWQGHGRLCYEVRTHTHIRVLVCSPGAFRVRVPLSVPHSAPHPVLTACVPRAYHMHAICSPEPGTPAPTPHTQHPLGRDIPVETVVARYSGQLYSMPEFEAALFEDSTSGD